MPNHQLLDNITHKDLRIITEHNIKVDDIASYTNIVISEFQQAQSHYPIFFRKNGLNGQFEAIALFGLTEQENLFLDNEGWHASYIPLTVQKRPFLIGFQEVNQAGKVTQQSVAYIDMDSPRINKTQGEAIFMEKGKQSPYLEHISTVLNVIHEGHQATTQFINILLKNNLIESVNINIQLNDGNKIELAELYTINEEKLAELQSENLLQLHQQGYLKLVYMIIASMSNMSTLIDLKNKYLIDG